MSEKTRSPHADQPDSVTSGRPGRYTVIPQRGKGSFRVRYVETSHSERQCPFCIGPR